MLIEMLLALIFAIGCSAVSSIIFTGATMLTPFMMKPDEFFASVRGVVLIFEQPQVLIKTQASNENLEMLDRN